MVSGTDGGGVESGTAPPQRPTTLHLRTPARPGAVPVLRHRTGDWLAALEWPPDELDDLNLAIAEACTNAVEHAYGDGPAGDVLVTAHVEVTGGARRVVAVVRDWGRWRPAPDDPGCRGHGLTVMRACVDELRVRRDLPGTAVTLVSAAVPLLGAEPPTPRPASPLRRRPADVTARALDPAERRHRRVTVEHHSHVLRSAAAQTVERAAAAYRRAHDLTEVATTCTADAGDLRAAGQRRRAG